MFYIVSYAAFSIPAVIAGFASTHAGLHATTVTYALAVLALALLALAIERRGKPKAPAAQVEQHDYHARRRGTQTI